MRPIFFSGGGAPVRLVGCKLSTHPGQIEHGGDLAHKVITWYHLVEPELVKKLLLLCFSCPIIVRLRSESCQESGSSRVIDTWATERRSCGFQGWHHTRAHCAAVRLIPIGRADGAEI
jgi:hypothetical protein